jgi:hypothetical protein
MARVVGPGGPEDEDAAENILREILSDIVVGGGRKEVAERVSLNTQHPDMSEVLDRHNEKNQYQPEAFQRALEMLARGGEAANVVVERHGGVPDPVGEADSIEAALAEEILNKLPRAVDRAATLDGLNLGRIPIRDKGLKRYFEEAHRCYLYGFDTACAVLCRAIIETALENVIDPMHVIKNSKKSEDSYIEALAIEAGRGGILTDDRCQCVSDIRDAGNKAVHDHPTFERRWLPRLAEIVDNTRKVLIDLYPNEA